MPNEETQYLIKNMIVFNALDNTFYLKDHPAEILTIGLVPGRLFRYLLSHAGRVVSKDKLLASVWDDYGLRSSGHSLNQNISLLRKTLISLGCEDEVIRTLPRLGYLIKDDLVDVIHHDALCNNPAEANSVKRKAFVPGHQRLLFAGGLSLLLLLVTIFFLESDHENRSADIPLQTLDAVDGFEDCPVFTTKSGLQDHKMLRKLASHLITQFACTTNVFYIISADDSVLLSGRNGRVFFTRCLLDTKNNLISGCDTIYDRDYSEEN